MSEHNTEPTVETPPAETTATATLPATGGGKHGGFLWGTGRRKKAIARVRIRPGNGKFIVNKREIPDYFKSVRDQEAVHQPLSTVGQTGQWDVYANVGGGGMTGQADAIKLGLARALVKADQSLVHALREAGLLTRDARMKERKKYGRRGARRGMQWAKR